MSADGQRTLSPYLVAQATQFAAGGMMAVLFPWLITQVLHESQARVGAGQALVNLPFLFLILVGGTLADGRDLRQFLPRLQLAMACVPLLLALVVASNTLTFAWATGLLVILGIFSAFATPARDALLSHVVPPETGLTRAAALAVAASFGGQVVGTLIAASASLVGAVPLLALQSVLLVVSAILVARLSLVTPFSVRAATGNPLQRIRQELVGGLRVVWQHERLRTIVAYLFLGAPLYNGMFLVGLPLMVRDVYAGNSGMLSLLFTAFLSGLTISSFAFSRLKPAERPGRLLLLLSPNNILVFALVCLAPPFPLFVALMLWWGLSAGIMMSLTRGMVQEAAPGEFRARVLSILQFANLAGGPIGAVLFGTVAQAAGITAAVAMVPAGATLLWLGFRLLTPLWNFRHEPAGT